MALYTDKKRIELSVRAFRERVAKYRARAIPRLDTGDAHIYRDTKHQYPSASELVKMYSIFGYDAIKPEIIEDAAMIGRAVHSTIEADLEGMPVPDLGMAQGDQRYINTMKAYDKFRADHPEFHTIATELQLVSPTLGYGGTLDWVGILGDRLMILDWKTPEKVNAGHFLQLELYALLLRSQLKINADNAIVLLSKTTGQYTIKKYSDPCEARRFTKHTLTTYRKLISFSYKGDGRRHMDV